MHTVKDRLAGNCIPCLGQTCAKLYTLFRTERTKTIPCPAAHPHGGRPYKGVPPPPRDSRQLLNLWLNINYFCFLIYYGWFFFSLLSGKLLFSLVWEEWVLIYEIIKTKVTLTTRGILGSTFWCAGYLAQLANHNPNPFTVFSMTKRPNVSYFWQM